MAPGWRLLGGLAFSTCILSVCKYSATAQRQYITSVDTQLSCPCGETQLAEAAPAVAPMPAPRLAAPSGAPPASAQPQSILPPVFLLPGIGNFLVYTLICSRSVASGVRSQSEHLAHCLHCPRVVAHRANGENIQCNFLQWNGVCRFRILYPRRCIHHTCTPTILRQHKHSLDPGHLKSFDKCKLHTAGSAAQLQYNIEPVSCLPRCLAPAFCR